ncbi:MAG TPA: TolC family protein [Polyangiaceae bacterium]|nr:TolC family protein [Polyangiaceae bacterium]
MNRLLLSLCGGLLTSLVSSAGAAQSSRQLSEQDAVAAAVAANPSLHVALLRAQQGRYGLRAEEALYTPIFDANAGYTHSRTPSLYNPPGGEPGTVVRGSDVFDVGVGLTKPFAVGTVLSASLSGQRSSRPSLQEQAITGASGASYSLVGRLSATQPLLRGFGTDVGLATLRQARLSLTADQLAAQQAATDLLGQVVSAYWELWYSAEVVHINEASRELAKVQQEQAQQQVQSGALAPASALPYATQVAQLEEAVLSAQTDVRQRELQLLQLLGDQRGFAQSLAAADVPKPPDSDEPVEARAVSDALAHSYARKQLQTQLAILKDQLKIAGDPLRPRLDLDAYLQAQGLGNRRVPPAFQQFGEMEAVSAHVGLTFEMPITDTRRSAQVQSAQLAAHVTEKQIEENELSIRSSVASALAQRRAAREKLLLASETEKVARAQAEAERARFQAGGSIAIAVQQAEDSWRQAQLRQQRARVDLVLADLTLAQLRGELLPRYAEAVSRLPAEERTTLQNDASGNF